MRSMRRRLTHVFGERITASLRPPPAEFMNIQPPAAAGVTYQSVFSAPRRHRCTDSLLCVNQPGRLLPVFSPRLPAPHHDCVRCVGFSPAGFGRGLTFTSPQTRCRFYCEETRLWAGTVFGYTAKTWARSLMERQKPPPLLRSALRFLFS